MTDNEIIENLNKCLSFEMFKLTTDLTIIDVVDLINRLTEQLNSAINGQETLQGYIAKQEKEIERLKAVNKLENTVHETLDVLDEHLKFETQAAKAEAYKEFAERLKMLGRFTDGDRYYIDNLLKEMTENN